jgi:hypothetical protein
MGGTKVFAPPPSATAAVSAAEAHELGLAHESRARLNVGGKPYELSRDVVVLGRSRECDITLDDANVRAGTRRFGARTATGSSSTSARRTASR